MAYFSRCLAFILPIYAVLASLNLVQDTSASNLTLQALPEYQCVSYASWTGDGFYPQACYNVFTYFKNIEQGQYENVFEFLSTDTPSATRVPRMELPRRYSLGKQSLSRPAERLCRIGLLSR